MSKSNKNRTNNSNNNSNANSKNNSKKRALGDIKNDSKSNDDIKKPSVEDLYPPKEPAKKKLSPEERSHDPNSNLAKQKKELANEIKDDPESKNHERVVSEDHLELKDMSRKERRQYKRQQEKEKLAELTFWRKVQYILMYYTKPFLLTLAGIALVAMIGYRIYIGFCPVALNIITVNDFANATFEPEIINLYSSYYEQPDNARYVIDINYEIHPNTTYTSADMAYYTKMYSVMTGDVVNVVLCDPDVVDYYAVDGFALEMKHALPEDLFEFFEDRMYECEGPVEDSDLYAIDLTGTEFVKRLELSNERPMFMMPGSLSEENREKGYNVLRIIMDLEKQKNEVKIHVEE